MADIILARNEEQTCNEEAIIVDLYNYKDLTHQTYSISSGANALCIILPKGYQPFQVSISSELINPLPPPELPQTKLSSPVERTSYKFDLYFPSPLLGRDTYNFCIKAMVGEPLDTRTASGTIEVSGEPGNKKQPR
jgi:hypothetical protein